MAEFGSFRIVDDAPGRLHVRPPAVRDADRLLYSSNFRRLGGVTQVVPPDHTLVHHDRLTHSLKVAQVSRRIAFFLKDRVHAQVDIDAAYAAGLAHDIGHPPFGHHGESVFQEWCEAHRFAESFEGNAQSLRIIAKNAIRGPGDSTLGSVGLNWSWRSIAATVKYPRLRHERGRTHAKWGAYDSEAELLAIMLERVPDRGAQSGLCVEAQVMDYADDISYAIHDVDDFYRLGLIPPHDGEKWRDFLAVPDVRDRVYSAYLASGYSEDEFDKVFAEAGDYAGAFLPTHPRSLSAAAEMGMQVFTEESIATFIDNVVLDDCGDLTIHPLQRVTIEILKSLTRFYVWEHNSEVGRLQDKQRVLLGQLLQRLLNRVEAVLKNWRPATGATEDGFMPHEAGSTTLPPLLEYFVVEALYEELEQPGLRDRRASHIRGIMDFLCFLTDAQVVALAISEGLAAPDRTHDYLYIPV